MDYTATIEWLFKQFPSYQQIGKKAYKPDLGNIIQLCNHLQLDYNSLKYVHIAGTNGKGSTTNLIASICIEAGLKTGVFSSPHLLDFRERIAINSDLIPQEEVILFCEKIRNLDFSPSFFEITFALALAHFIKHKCDICIIETGLGGRLDATNIITPILSIITNISLDHTDLLGETISEIAFEKAGIIKQNQPVVIGETSSESLKVFEKIASERNSDLHIVPENQTDQLDYKTINENTVKYSITFLSDYFNITQKHIIQGIENIFKNRNFLGRFQYFENSPNVILDVAHNPAGIEQLFKLVNQQICDGRLHIIYGASSDKNVQEIISLFPKDAFISFCEFSTERTMKIENFKHISSNFNLKFNFFHTIQEAYNNVKNSVNKNDTMIITGSFFLISDFLRFFSPNHLQK